MPFDSFDTKVQCEERNTEISSEQYFNKKVRDVEKEFQELNHQLDLLLDSPYNNI